MAEDPNDAIAARVKLSGGDQGLYFLLTGLGFGYPLCCVAQFVNDEAVGINCSGTIRDPGDLDHVPCYECQTGVFN